MSIMETIKSRDDDFIRNELISLIAEYGARSVIDFGCGKGELLQSLHDYKPDLTLVGIDSLSHWEMQGKNVAASAFRFVDKESQSFDAFVQENRFDLLCSTFALHHFRSPILELKRMETLLKPGGILLLYDMVSSYQDEAYILPALIASHAQTMAAFQGKFHRRSYTIEEIEDLLRATKFTTVKKSVRMPSLTAEEQEQFSRHFIELYNDAQAKNEDVVQYNNPLLVSHARMMRDYFIALLEKHGRRMEKMMLLVCRKS